MARRKAKAPLSPKPTKPDVLPRKNPAPFDYTRVVEGCAVKGCKGSRVGFVTAVGSADRAWFAPICRKHCKQYYGHIVLSYRYIAEQYGKDFEKLAHVFNTTPKRVKELAHELQSREATRPW